MALRIFDTDDEKEMCNRLCKHSIGDEVILAEDIQLASGKLQAGTVMIIKGIMIKTDVEFRPMYFSSDEIDEYEADNGVFVYILGTKYSDVNLELLVDSKYIGEKEISLDRTADISTLIALLVLHAALIIASFFKPFFVVFSILSYYGLFTFIPNINMKYINERPMIRKKFSMKLLCETKKRNDYNSE